MKASKQSITKSERILWLTAQIKSAKPFLAQSESESKQILSEISDWRRELLSWSLSA